jgi:PKD repeat protein
MKNIFLTLAGLLFFSHSNAQKWVTMMSDTNANYYDIVKEFDAYWKDREVEKGKGYKTFKRWQWFVEPRVYPSGNLRYASRTYALEQLQKEEKAKKLSANTVNAVTANWIPLGPFGSPQGGDAGRIQTIRMHPAGTNTFYVGTAAGGFWMTNNAGASYTTTTDQLGSCGVSDIAVNPLNPNIIYISTGDKDADDTHSIGVMKSTNGGLTWSATGLAWMTSQQRRIYRLLINPINPNTLIAATSVGIYKTVNAGLTWSLTSSNGYVDAEYKPGDTTVVYAVTNGSCMKSTNGGNTFTNAYIGNFTSTRLSLAVTPANNNYVYILVGATNNGFGGLYRSTNSAGSFSLMSTAPNIMDWSTNGSGTGGQAWYDIAIDASPTNADEIVAGGVNTWRSLNGGATWGLHTHWTGSGGRPYVHADLHVVLYTSGTTIFLGTDGGVARTTNGGSNYSTINGNMNIAQMYKISNSTSTPSLIIAGHQDNGSNLLNGANWAQKVGGDGMDCFISNTSNSVMVASTQNGGFRRSTNGGNSWAGITNGLTGSAPWVSPIVQDPNTPNTFYCGYQNVFKSTNQGGNWTAISSFNAGVDEIKVAPSNNSVIYVTTQGAVWKTINGGASWSNVTGSFPGQITDLAIDNQNHNNIYVTISGYSAGSKVYYSNNGGTSWINYSTGLPNIPANCIIYKNNSPQVLYVGTDVGVYYREASMTSWIPFSTGLPNIVVNDLEIYYPSGKLRAGTYARGVWETDLYSDPLAAPFSAFSANFTPACINTPLQFNDVSSNNPTSWVWSFAGASPATSTLQSPSVTYPTVGTYTVSLLTNNANGAGPVYTTTISVVNAPTIAPISASICAGQGVNFSVTTNAQSVNWANGQQGNFISIPNPTASLYSFTASLGACNSVGAASLYIDPVPPTPVIINNFSSLTTTVTSVNYQWYQSATAITGATLATFVPTVSGYYSVWVTIGNCSTASPFLFFDLIDDIKSYTSSFLSIKPNPVENELTITFAKENAAAELRVLNSLGQLVKMYRPENSSSEVKLNTSNFSKGLYYLSIKEGTGTKVVKFIKD